MRKTYKNRLPKNMEASSINAKVVDGEVIVEVEMKERFLPKDGDFLVTGRGNVFIYNPHYQSVCVPFYVGINSLGELIVHEKGGISGFSQFEDCRYATSGEKATFLERLEKEYGKRWNAEKKCLENIYIPKFGDIVKVIDEERMDTSRDYMIVIWPEGGDISDQKNGFFNIANISYGGFLSLSCGSYTKGKSLEIVPASESEKQELFNALDKAGKRWNPETKQLEDIRWKPKARECYFYADYDGEVRETVNVSICDAFRISMNNCFKTKEAAKPYAEQMKEIFKNSKAE